MKKIILLALTALVMVGCGVNTELPDITMECPVDACVAMIEKLHKIKLLRLWRY